MLEPHEAEMLGRVVANVCQLLVNDRDKEVRIKVLEPAIWFNQDHPRPRHRQREDH
jgi:hypothetical protein